MKAEITFLSIVLVFIALTLSACTPQQIAEFDAHQKDVLITFTTPQTEPQMINTFTQSEKTEIINPYFSIQNSTGELFRLDHAGNFYLYPLINCDTLDTDGSGLLSCGTDADTNFTTTGNMTAGWFLGSFNWTVGDDYNSFDGNTLTFNETKLETVYYNANSSNLIAGTVNSGTVVDTQHPDGSYDSITFNFTEASGSPGLDMRLNFTSVEDFSRGVIRYKTSSLAGDYPIIQVWNYNDSVWEDYPPLAQSLTFATITQPVFDSSEHLEGNIVQMRLYKASNGNTNNHYYVDWVAISKGFGVPSGEEIDPYSWHRASTGETGNFVTTGNVTAGYFFGNGSQLTGRIWGNTTAEIFNAVDNNSFAKLAEIIAFGYYNASNFDIADYSLTTAILGWSYYNATDFSISDYSTTSNILGFGYYNVSDFDIADYSTTAEADNLYTNDTDTDTTYTNTSFDISQLSNTGNIDIGAYNLDVGTNTTTENLIFEGNTTFKMYANETCVVINVATTYFEVCR